MAFCYRHPIDLLESVQDIKIEILHVVGSGTQYRVLSEIAAAIKQRQFICGPVEANPAGNLLTQAMGCGELLS